MKHGVWALLLACRKAATLPLMLQKAAEMKKYDNVSTQAEAGRCSSPACVWEQSNEGIKQACRSGKHVASG